MRVTGPLFSIEATGTIGGIISAANWRGRQFVKKNTKPRTAYTPNQRSARVRIGFLKALWRHINAISGVDAQALWSADADQSTTTGYHWFIAYNSRRWTSEQGPILLPTGNPPGTGNPVGGDLTFTATSLRCKAFGGFDPTMWGWMLYIQTVIADPPPIGDLAFISPDYAGVTSPRFFEVTHIAPGDYQIWKRALNTDGSMSAVDSIGFHTFP